MEVVGFKKCSEIVQVVWTVSIRKILIQYDKPASIFPIHNVSLSTPAQGHLFNPMNVLKKDNI